jgi:tetratricopeptide (TPR) repeat protein
MNARQALLLIVALTCGSVARGQEKQPWNGVKVVTKYAQPIRDGQKMIDDGTTFRVYVVKEAVGDRLQILWGGSQGWINVENVVTLDKAIEFYTQEIEDDPRNASAYDWRGMVWGERKEFDKAIADYDRSIAINPGRAFPWNNRGTCHSAKKDFDKAIADYNEAIELDPDHALAFDNRGIARMNLKEYEKALADFAHSIELKPEFVSPYNEQAWIWATCPDPKFRDGEKAIASATKACELSGWKDASYLDTLAAAYAESAFFGQAKEWQEKALTLSKSGSPARKDYRNRLELYKKSVPYRMP